MADDDVESVFGSPPTSVRAERRAAMILQKLPENYRRILQLRFIDACSVRDAADALGISVANAKVLQHRAFGARPSWTGRTDDRARTASLSR